MVNQLDFEGWPRIRNTIAPKSKRREKGRKAHETRAGGLPVPAKQSTATRTGWNGFTLDSRHLEPVARRSVGWIEHIARKGWMDGWMDYTKGRGPFPIDPLANLLH